MPKTRPPFPEEFRREAVRLARVSGKPYYKLARDLGVSDPTLRKWIRRAQADGSDRPDSLGVDEREELARLRRENQTLRMEREILAKAAAFFAKETDGR